MSRAAACAAVTVLVLLFAGPSAASALTSDLVPERPADGALLSSSNELALAAALRNRAQEPVAAVADHVTHHPAVLSTNLLLPAALLLLLLLPPGRSALGAASNRYVFGRAPPSAP
jgi:hypothetical protein